jgi:hypothetical protein
MSKNGKLFPFCFKNLISQNCKKQAKENIMLNFTCHLFLSFSENEHKNVGNLQLLTQHLFIYSCVCVRVRARARSRAYVNFFNFQVFENEKWSPIILNVVINRFFLFFLINFSKILPF